MTISWEILEVKPHQPRDSRLVGYHLDSPKPGTAAGKPLLEISGWALESTGPALAVGLSCDGTIWRRVAMNQRRPDLGAGVPAIPGAERGGFRAALGCFGLDEQRLEVRAVLRDQSRAPVGTIRVRRACTAEERNAPLVSVVIPCYRQAHFLGEAIESVLGQTYPNVEVIVVDDGSPDNTAQVAACYPGVVYVRGENAWVAAARNTGLARSRSNYVIFLDSDDRLLPCAVQAGLEAVQSNPKQAFVSGQYRFIGVGGDVVFPPTRWDIRSDHYLELLRRNYISML